MRADIEGAIMIPGGFMAKRVMATPDWLKAEGVVDIYSVSSCMSRDFADYVGYWKHNAHWLFDSPEVIRGIAEGNAIDMSGVKLFYYEIYEHEFHEDDKQWHPYRGEEAFATNVSVPTCKQEEGFDVVTFWAGSKAECSPLSCNGLAEQIATNRHCLLDSIEQARQSLEDGLFRNCEPGPYRIFAVYSVE